MANNYEIDYKDERFTKVENEKNQAINETKNTYNEMINSSDSHYQEMIDASKDYANKQTEIQNQNTEFAIEKINQAKDQAKKEYEKEQKGAYVDYKKSINEYGSTAESLASQGLQESGVSESTRTNNYTVYQNRYASARESYSQAILNYDNSIKEAQLANSSALATIAYEALQKQLELSLQGFQYKNTLVLQKLEAVNADKDRYYKHYQDVLQQINTENTLAEQVRQYNEKMAEEKRQYNESLALQKEQLAEEKRQYNESLAFQKSKAAQDQSNWEKEYALAQKKSSVSSSSGSSDNKKYTLTEKEDKKEDNKSSEKLTQTSSSSNSSSSGTYTPVFGGKSSTTVKLSNGHTGYTSAKTAYQVKGGKSPYSESYLASTGVKKGLVSKVTYNGKTYYY